jgi:hypothetical protein
MTMLLDYLIVAVFGAAIGATELLSRYRDAPFKSLRGPSAIAYIALNLLSAVGALWLSRLFDVTYGIDPAAEAERLRWAQVFAAGFGAMVILRSSIFSLNIGDQTVSIGPSSILDALLGILDREVDRRRAQDRADEVLRIAKDISFRNAKEQLPIVAFALMQNVSRDEQDKVINKMFGLEKQAGMSDKAKAQALCLALMEIVGDKVLDKAVTMIKKEIKETPLDEVINEDLGLVPDVTEGEEPEPEEPS